MDSVYQLLTYILGSTSVLGAIGSVVYYKQTRRAKEAEALQKEAEAEMRKVEVEKAKIENRKSEVELLRSQLERAETRLSELNDAIDKHIDRRHELADRLCDAEQEVNRVNRLLVEAKDEIIRLTEKSDRLEAVKCLRTDCKDPRGPKPPRKNQKDTEHT